MTNLAVTYREQGRWNEAEHLQVQVMEMRKKLIGAEHPDTLNSMTNLAVTYYKLSCDIRSRLIYIGQIGLGNLGRSHRSHLRYIRFAGSHHRPT